MSGSKQNVGQQDRVRVEANDSSEVEFVHRQFPELSHQQVLEAIKENGPLREDIYKKLETLKGKS